MLPGQKQAHTLLSNSIVPNTSFPTPPPFIPKPTIVLRRDAPTTLSHNDLQVPFLRTNPPLQKSNRILSHGLIKGMFRLRLRNSLYHNRNVLVQFAEVGERFNVAVGVDECVGDDFAHGVVFEEGDVIDCVGGWFGGGVYVGGVYADCVV